MEDWNWETIFYTHYTSSFNYCHIIRLKINRIRWKKRKIRAITAFKVIEVGTNRKPVCDFLLVINSNWHPISYRFGVIARYCSNFGHFAFSSHPLGGDNVNITDNVPCSSRAHWKAHSGLNVNWTFSLGVTSESLQAKRDQKSAISIQNFR